MQKNKNISRVFNLRPYRRGRRDFGRSSEASSLMSVAQEKKLAVYAPRVNSREIHDFKRLSRQNQNRGAAKADPLFWRGRRDLPFEHGARLTAQAEGCQVCGRPADFPPLKPRSFRIKISLRAVKTARRDMARKARFRAFVRSVVAKKRYAKKCCYGLRSSRELALTSRFQVTCRTNENRGTA